ncbi:beta strand repeat-containing protein [Aeoliella mucimassa]|nr:Ig-like domain-containing protein [Aeoliella mucimassa]
MTRTKSKTAPAQRRPLGHESLEQRIVLDATGLEGNPYTPDLDLSAIATQEVVAGDTLTLDLLTAGGTISDPDGEGNESGDTFRFMLDPDVPDDTPTGATITSDGVLTWTPTESQLGTFEIVIIVVDEGSPVLADAETITVVVSSANASPEVDLNGSEEGTGYAASFTEGDDPVTIVDDENLTVSDEDNTELVSASIIITNASDGEDEVLSVDTTDTNISAEFDESTNTLTLTGADTLENYQKVLRTLTYENTSASPTEGDRTIEVLVRDGDAVSDAAVSTVTVSGENTTPEVDLNGETDGQNSTATFVEGAGAVSIVDASMTVVDADNDNLDIAVITISNLMDGDAELLAVDTTGTNITAGYNNANGVLTLSGSDTVANYQQVLRTLTYNNTSDDPSTDPRAILVIVSDGANYSTIRTSTISITTANDAPAFADLETQTAYVGEEMVVVVTASDVDSSDTLTFSLDTSNSPASATITQTGANTAEIRWTPGASDEGNSVGFAVLVSDDGTPVMSDNLEFSAMVNAARPTVDLNGDSEGTGFLVSFIENDFAVPLAEPDVAITTDSSTTITSATVTITNFSDGTAEVLAADTTGTSITASYDDTTGILSLTGVDTIANYQSVIASLSYQNTSEDPTAGDRAIEVVVNDGVVDSLPATATVTVFAINDVPDLTLPAPYDAPETPVEVTEFTTVSFTATGTDLDHTADELQFLIDSDDSGLPDGAAIPTITNPGGVFSWTPDATGTYSFRILLVDSEGDVDQELVTFTVVDDTTAPTVVTAPSGDLTGSIGSLTVTFSEAMGSAAFDIGNYTLEIVGGTNDGTVVSFVDLTQVSDTSVTLNLATDLAIESYELTLDNSLIDDLAENLLTGDNTFDFAVLGT